MHQETPYKTIQRTKYILQVVVRKLAAMSEKNNVCIICNEGSTSSKRLTNNPDMIRLSGKYAANPECPAWRVWHNPRTTTTDCIQAPSVPISYGVPIQGSGNDDDGA